MRVTKENIGQIFGSPTGHKRLESLLDELADINLCMNDNDYWSTKMSMFIDYEDKHTVYSPERTDTCPDYYGYFTLRWENEPSETIGDYMTIEELDLVLCALNDVLERKIEKS